MFAFDNSYARLPDRFYARIAPTPVRAPRIVRVNGPLADLLGVNATALATAEGLAMLSGNVVPEGAASIALAYAGHQFGHFVPQLGDGRAILLGEVVGTDGVRRDVQLKGAGPTPYSRRGDGRAALGPVLREYLVSETMAAYGIPTTRALAAVASGEFVARDQVLPGGVITRVAASHLRVGTFEFFSARQDREAVELLTEHALTRHYAARASAPEHANKNRAVVLLECVIEAQANLVAAWLGVGFVHGVMNTDNCSIAGETIDYGPCAFLDTYDPMKKFSSIDQQGRYAFMNQPRMAAWNLARLAETLLPLMHESEEEAARVATASLERFGDLFEDAFATVLRRKIGLDPHSPTRQPEDALLARDLLERLAANRVDFTLFFRRLAAAEESDSAKDAVASLFSDPSAFVDWASTWQKRLTSEATTPTERAAMMKRANPIFIPRNHRVEEALAAAVENGDDAPFNTLCDVLARPFDEQPAFSYLEEPPTAEWADYKTFCGT